MKITNNIEQIIFYLNENFKYCLENLVDEIEKMLRVKKLITKIINEDIPIEFDNHESEKELSLTFLGSDTDVRVKINSPKEENLSIDNIDKLKTYIDVRITLLETLCKSKYYKNIEKIKIKKNEYSTIVTNLLVKNFEVEFYE